MSRLRLTILLVFLSSTLLGQYRIDGKITDGETGSPLPGANIILEGSFLATTSRTDGTFDLKGIRQGNYTLRITYIGFETFTGEVAITGDQSLEVSLMPRVYVSDEVIISAIRAGGSAPTTYSVLTAEEVRARNSGKAFPYVMETLPSTVITSDAGNGVGYTGIRIRGTDLTGINVTLNGVPVNDAESHGVFFVDLPDLAASIDDMNVQRGVGASTNGAAAFGASINIKTGDFRKKAYAELSSAAGSFRTFRNALKFGSGMIKNKWVFDGRMSLIQSDGYIDRASSDLRSFYLSGAYYGKRDIVKAIVLHGTEKTYQAWYGVPKDSLGTNRTYNPAGEILDAEGKVTGYYDNQTDNYRQTYYQLHWGHEFNRRFHLASTLYYTRGLGYYENYRNDRSFASYGWNDTVIGSDTISRASLIDQKWLDNHFYGINLSLGYQANRWQFNFGSGANQYDGDHYGYVIWSQVARLGEYDEPWYTNKGLKTDFNVFAKTAFRATERLELYLDLQYRFIDYRITGTHDDLRDLTQEHTYHFFNPKMGIDYRINQRNSLNLYAGVANREPNRSVFRDADPEQVILPERLYDLELGYRYTARDLLLELNGFYMHYRDQLVHTGRINNVGAPVMTNVPSSFRAGIEFIGAVRLMDLIDWKLNATWSSNKILDYTAYVDDWTNWPEQVSQDLGRTDISFSPAFTLSSSLSAEPVDSFVISLVSKQVSRQYLDNTSSDLRSLDPFFVNNLEFRYEFSLKAVAAWDFWLHLNNIFNVQYETYGWVYRYYYEGSEYEMNGYFPQAGFNFMIGTNIRF